MSEKQEKAWVVMRGAMIGEPKPVKVFDDRKDARSYARRLEDRSKIYSYWYTGVKKG